MNLTFIIVSILLVAAAANFNNVSSRRTFELSPPSRNGCKKRIWLPEMPKPNQTAFTTINTGNLQPSSTPGNITIGNIDSNGVNLGSSNGPLRISNGNVWVRGKLVYTIPANKSFSMTAKHIVVDGVPVVDIVTGEVLVPNQKQNSTAKTSPPIKKSTSDGRIPYAKPNTVVEGANGQVKVDGVVVISNDQNFKDYGWVDMYVSGGKMFFNGNVILLDDPNSNIKMGNLIVRNNDLHTFQVDFDDGVASFSAEY